MTRLSLALPLLLAIAAVAGVWSSHPAFKIVACIIIIVPALIRTIAAWE